MKEHPPPFIPPPQRGICVAVISRPSGGFVLRLSKFGDFTPLPPAYGGFIIYTYPPAYGGGIKGGGFLPP